MTVSDKTQEEAMKRIQDAASPVDDKARRQERNHGQYSRGAAHNLVKKRREWQQAIDEQERRYP